VQLVLVRHGETDANKTHTIQGHLDTSLSELGEKQAVKVGELLAKENFHLAITSDLKRAKSTGQAICDRNSSFESLKEYTVLRERCFGDLEGKPLHMMMDAIKDKSKPELFAWGPTNGESGVTFRARIQEFLDLVGRLAGELAEPEPTILATSHGGFIRDFNMLLVSKYNCKMPTDSGEYGRICPNTGVSRYSLKFSATGETLETAECTQLYYKEHLKDLSVVEPVLYGV